MGIRRAIDRDGEGRSDEEAVSGGRWEMGL
jgi:hypothetical protein